MSRKHFQIEVKPDFTPTTTAAAFNAGDVLFNWEPFKLPHGVFQLVGCTAICRGADDGTADQAMDLYFATKTRGNGDIASGSAPSDLGTQNSAPAPNNPPWNDIIGGLSIIAADFSESTVGMNIANASSVNQGRIFFDTTDEFHTRGGIADTSGPEKEYTFYVAATCGAAIDFTSDCDLTGNHNAAAANDLTVDGTDARLLLAPGDVIKAGDNAVIGTVGTIPDSTSILLANSATNTAALATDDQIFNINPVRLRFTFKRLS